jgi:chemotaxis protein MotA
MMVSGNLNAHEIEVVHGQLKLKPTTTKLHGCSSRVSPALAGALPAFGIVAAVLGVVNTMGSVGQPPAVLGGMIGSALVGTFLGILLGLWRGAEPSGWPAGAESSMKAAKELQCHQDNGTVGQHARLCSHDVAIEFGRKVLYSTERPTFAELEAHVKKK